MSQLRLAALAFCIFRFSTCDIEISAEIASLKINRDKVLFRLVNINLLIISCMRFLIYQTSEKSVFLGDLEICSELRWIRFSGANLQFFFNLCKSSLRVASARSAPWTSVGGFENILIGSI